MSGLYVPQDPDILGFSPPLFLGSENEGVLYEFRRQSLAVLHRHDVERDIDHYVKYLFQQPERIRAFNQWVLHAHISDSEEITLFSDPASDAHIRAQAKIIQGTNKLTLTDLFPESEGKSFVNDLAKLGYIMKAIVPEAKKYMYYFWTLSLPFGAIAHCDLNFSILRNYDDLTTEVGPREAFSLVDEVQQLYKCTNENVVKRIQRGDTVIFKPDTIHRLATSNPPRKLRLCAGVVAVGMR